MSTATGTQTAPNNGAFGDEIRETIIEGPLTLSPEVRGEVDIQISTAKRYPRSIRAFKQQALEMATFDEETAAGCFYSMPRGGKPIEGPSTRLAEIVLSAWGNVRADARVIGADEKEITAEAMTWDLEKNVAIRVQVKRKITDKNGRRYSDDMVTVTGNAACSIALRNSVFKVIPMVYTKSVYQAARQVAIGDIQTLAAKRAEMVTYFGKMGITPERVFAAIGKSNIEEIGLDELAMLKGTATAIKDGDVSVDEAFPATAPTGPSGVGGLKDRIKKTDAPVESETPIEPAQPDHVEPEVTASAPVDEDPIEDPTDETVDSAESQLVDLQASAKERLHAITGGKARATSEILDGRRIENLSLKQLKDFIEELEKLEAAQT